MITRACRWAKLEFGLGDIKEEELVTLRNTSDPSKGMPKNDFISAIIAIKENNPEGYYRNLEYRLGQTIKKEKNKTEKENLKVIYRKLIRYNWSSDPSNLRDEGSQNVLSPSDAPPGTPGPPGPPGPADSSELPGSSGSPEPSTSNADEHRTDKRKVKKESIRTLTKAEREKFDACIQREDLKFNELNIVEVNINNTLPRYYMKSDDGIVRHVGRDPISQRTPLDLNFPDVGEKGTFKKLTKFDMNYVKLEAIEDEDEDEEDMEYNRNSRDTHNKRSIGVLRNYPSACQSVFVSPKEMIASNGGKSLAALLENKLKLKQFEQLTKDIYLMQKNDLFMTDIKPENLVCSNYKEGIVRLIDTDSICCGNDGLEPSISFLYTTYILYNLFDKFKCEVTDFDGNIQKEKLTPETVKYYKQLLSNAVSYALLKTLIELNYGARFPVRDLVTNVAIGMDKLGSNQNDKSTSEVTNKWITENVKPEHRNMMRQFSMNPHLHKGIIDFSSILNFNKSPLSFLNPLNESEI